MPAVASIWERVMEFGRYRLNNLSKFNVVLGKNGTGKSTLLRALEENGRRTGLTRYISPERGGQLDFDGNVYSHSESNPGWLGDNRRKNQFGQFRQSSVSEYRRLETLVLGSIEKDMRRRADYSYTFDTTIGKINCLLDRLRLERVLGGGFKLIDRESSNTVASDSISSGESELISLAIEALVFAHSCAHSENAGKPNWLLLDEPDVHLHPDLQARFVGLVIDALKDAPGSVLIATHSTPIVAALAKREDAAVAFMRQGEVTLDFEPIGSTLKAVLPMFGAHPLSNIFNLVPILLVEGEDDERIWQAACRSSIGAVAVWPCPAGSIDQLNEYERKADLIIASVYDEGRGFSLRDRDDAPYEINPIGAIIRMRLACRTAENLLLSDDVLASLGTDWAALQAAMEVWIGQNAGHPQYAPMTAFCDGGWNRREANLKRLRNLLMGIVGSEKPWEVAVGQAIAALKMGSRPVPAGDTSLTAFLGPDVIRNLGF